MIGQVKWFNKKSGYGFVKVLTGDYKEEDIFVHHSEINVEGYKYLMEGEYISFDVTEEEDKKKAVNVTGIEGGRLMCEVRNERRPTLDTHDDRVKKEWMVVRRKRSSSPTKRSTSTPTFST